MSEITLIVGLGNPGQKYAETRHNAGFWFIDRLASQTGVSLKPQSKLHSELVKTQLYGRTVMLLKPDTYMNRSGLAVRAVMDYYRVSLQNVVVAYDELDLPPGVARLKQGGGHGGHNGLRDLFAHLGDKNFIRLRLGIGHPGVKNRVTAYVLSRSDARDQGLMDDAIDRAIDVLPQVLDGNLAGAMNDLHRTNSQPDS